MNLRHSILAFLILVTFQLYGQNHEPHIIILPARETTFDKSFEKELKEFNEKFKSIKNKSQQEAFLKSKEFSDQPENIRLMIQSAIRFSEAMDFFSSSTLYAQQYLSYRFMERFPDQLILLLRDSSRRELSDLKAVADKERAQYVLNFQKIEIYKEQGIGYARMKVQLFDNLEGQFAIDDDFIGDWNNPGFEFSCQDKSISCTTNNALAAALPEVIEVIANNSPTLKKARQLSQQRYDELVSNHLNKPFDLPYLKAIIQETKSDIPLEHIYQVLYDESKSKFVAFSVEKVESQDFKTFKDNKKDNNVNIISSKDIKDKGFLDAMPQTYGFIVTGVNHNGRWYVEKSKVTYFEANSLEEGKKAYFNNLQEWNFFNENTATPSPDFWETGLFEKVRDLRKDPQWEKYGKSSWQTREANNRPYVGMYEIVANAIRKQKQEENEQFEKTLKDQTFTPAYNQLKHSHPKEYSKYSAHSLIYASDRKAVINPVLVTSKKEVHTLRYFVTLPGSQEVYEWTYFPPEQIKSSNLFGSNVVDRMNTVTEWNFSYDALDDKNFWETYVLLKEGAGFKYLKKIN